jgi:hypothetical protein
VVFRQQRTRPAWRSTPKGLAHLALKPKTGENTATFPVGVKMRRWLILFSVLLFAGLVAAVGHWGLGWWQSHHTTTNKTETGYDAASEKATLQEAMATARDAIHEIEDSVHDFSATIVKKERIGDKLIETVMFAKIREKPFAVYLYFLDRSDNKGVKGREVVYVEGRNEGKLIVHTPGLQDATVGKMALPPKGLLAMMDERHPIVEIGLANLCRQLIQRGDAAGDPSQVQVKRYPRARINTRPCFLYEIIYPVQEPKVRGYLARVFVDSQLRFPIRVEVYEIPVDQGLMPRLLEEYTYLDLKLNVGYSDADFDPKNPQYKFP